MLAAVLELDPRASHEILDGARDEHLTRPGQRGDSSPDVDSNPGHLGAVSFAFTGVEAETHLEALLGRRRRNRGRARDTTGGPVERREEPVSRRVDLVAAEARQVAPHCQAVIGDQPAPGLVAEGRGALRRAHDVREEDGRENAVRHRLGLSLGEEAPDLCGDLFRDERIGIRAGDADHARVWDRQSDLLFVCSSRSRNSRR